MIEITVDCKKDEDTLEEFQSTEWRKGRIDPNQIEGYYESSKKTCYISMKSGVEWHVKESISEIDHLIEISKIINVTND